MSWRTDLVSRVGQIADFGQVYEFERYGAGNNLKALQNLYLVDATLAGGFLRMTQGHTQSDAGTQGKQRTIELVLFSQWVDADESQLAFDDKLEELLQDSGRNARVGNDWLFKPVNNVVGWQLVENGPAMFGGVLVHMAKLRCTLYSLTP